MESMERGGKSDWFALISVGMGSLEYDLVEAGCLLDDKTIDFKVFHRRALQGL